jgi:putative transposase
MLPHDLPPWKTVYRYLRIWRIDGTLEKIHFSLYGKVRAENGRNEQPSAGIIDSQTVKTSSGERGDDAGKKIKGRKRHIIVDTMGLLLKVLVHPDNIQDRDGAKLLLGKGCL